MFTWKQTVCKTSCFSDPTVRGSRWRLGLDENLTPDLTAFKRLDVCRSRPAGVPYSERAKAPRRTPAIIVGDRGLCQPKRNQTRMWVTGTALLQFRLSSTR